MASPQKENGYTSIANELLEQIYGRRFSTSQLKILLLVFRFTYGFNRKFASLSNSFIANGTGIHEITVSKEVGALIDDGVLIEKQKPTFSNPRMIGVNKNYESWQNHIELAKTLRDKVKQPRVSKSAKKGISENANQESNSNKEKEEIALPGGERNEPWDRVSKGYIF